MPPITEGQRQEYARLRAQGLSKRAAARSAGISPTTAYKIEESINTTLASRRRRGVGSTSDLPPEALKGMSTYQRTRATGRMSHGNPWASGYSTLLDDDALPLPIPHEDLSPVASAALEDFGLFRRRYLGRTTSPWAIQATQQMLSLHATALATASKEFALVNLPPGVGKSTLFTHDLPCWLICRNRSVRIMVGSRTADQAQRYTARIRRTLQRRDLIIPPEDLVQAGLAAPSEAVLVEDYGRFKPNRKEVWQAGGFIVAQPGDTLVVDKEPTVTAFGFDSDYLGMRGDFVIWDDLVDWKNIRTQAQREETQKLYEDQAESRVDPRGLLILQGQRLGNDLYRWALNQRRWAPAGQPRTPKYHHIVFPAHFEKHCAPRHHEPDAPPWDGTPEGGCLLEPRRLPYQELMTIRENNPRKFRTVYQQEDIDPATQMVPELWVRGGTDQDDETGAGTGVEFPGCLDHDRAIHQLPGPLVPPVHSVAVFDPSPTQFWACHWLLYHPASEQRIYMDIDRRQMGAPQMLDWHHDTQSWVGIMEDWWQVSSALRHPIKWWIVENNAAQRFLLQYDHVTRWTRLRGVNIVPHATTAKNKPDPDLGVPSIAPHYRFGRVRLPNLGEVSRRASSHLIEEVTRYPDADTDDQVMAQWMFEWNRERLFPSRRSDDAPRLRRPSWLADTSSRSRPVTALFERSA